MKIAYIGLGKMGLNMSILMKEKGHEVFAWNRGEDGRMKGREAGLQVFETYADAIQKLEGQKLVWLMTSHGAVDEVIEEILPLLSEGDIIIDGGNSNYKDTLRRGEELKKKGIHFMDVGVSGGPKGALTGACLMIGGEKEVFEKLEPLFIDIAAPGAVAHLGNIGAGHFAKMVHNGIEYGMMQAIGEGFEVLKKSEFNYSLLEVAKIYNNKSVIESRLTRWLEDGFINFGENLEGISGEVKHSGEGEWTVNTAKELSVPVPVIEESFQFRVRSTGNPSFTGKVVSVLRTMFGGHDVSSAKNFEDK